MSQLYIRGSIIHFSAVCTDAAGAATTPDSANLYIEYTDLSGGRVKATIAMSVASSTVTAQWDSSVAQGASGTAGLAPGFIEWSIHTTGSDKITTDGSFTLWANTANTVS